MEITLYILSALIMLAGLIGCLLPVLPGPPLAWLGVLVLYFIPSAAMCGNIVIITAAGAVLVTLLDYVIPLFGTKLFGGSRSGVKGATRGMFISMMLMFTPVALVIPSIILFIGGPFFGAYLGETFGENPQKAMKAAWGSFFGFIFSVGLKMAVVVWYFVVFFESVFGKACA